MKRALLAHIATLEAKLGAGGGREWLEGTAQASTLNPQLSTLIP